MPSGGKAALLSKNEPGGASLFGNTARIRKKVATLSQSEWRALVNIRKITLRLVACVGGRGELSVSCNPDKAKRPRQCSASVPQLLTDIPRAQPSAQAYS